MVESAPEVETSGHVVEKTPEEHTQSRSEKKARKALEKLGLEKVQGIDRVTVRIRSGESVQVNAPDVYRLAGDSSKNGGMFFVFGAVNSGAPTGPGQMKQQDWEESARQMVEKDAEEKGAEAAEDSASSSAAPDDTPVDEKSIELIKQQAPNMTRDEIVAVLKKHNGDVVSAVMDVQNN